MIENSSEDVSLENATYLQNIEDMQKTESKISLEDIKQEVDEKPNFEVDSIELATPELFSNKGNGTESLSDVHNQKEEMAIFESSKGNEPELFENSDKEEDFEIPAFLRKQKN